MIENISSIIETGENIDIEINRDDGSILFLKSNVIEIQNSQTIIISSPIYKSNIYPISPGNEVKIIFYKKNTGKFYFLGEILKREKRNQLHILYVKCNSKIKRSQRRNYYRLNILLNVNLRIVDNGFEKSSIDCITKDISGGGIRVISKEKISFKSRVKCYIPIEDETICASGEVVRCEPVPDSITKYDIGIEFSSTDENIRSKLISFIFEKQRNLIKKGLI